MGVPDVLELKLRDIRDSMIEERFHLTEWDYEEVVYKEPGVYESTGKRGKIHPGEEWDNTGKNFFFTKWVKVPEELQGKELYLEIDIGGESALYVNGRLKRGLNEKYIYLTPEAKESYNLRIEATHHVHNAVKYPRLFEKDYPRHYFKKAALVHLNKEVEKFYFLLKNMKATLEAIDGEEERSFLEKGIYKALREINFYTDDRQEYLESINQARRELMDHLRSSSPSSTGKLFMIGHSHLDLAFKWPLKETIRKAKRTLATTLDLMERHPDLYFVKSQPQLYLYVKQYYPELYKRMKGKIKQGQLEPIGGMWVEADTNLISGESLVRQILYGKRFFQEEFGIETETCWLPDCFGFSAALPQILKKSGIKYFLTTKLSWNDTNEYPHNFLTWKGIDGSEVYTCLTTKGYGGEINPEEMIKTWQDLKDKDLSESVIYMYGHGDGGGGVTEGMLKDKEAVTNIPHLPEVTTGKVEKHLKQVFSSKKEFPAWWGELYFEKHRGVYTSQAVLKKHNRKSEYLFREAEIFSSLARATGLANSNQEKLAERDKGQEQDKLNKGWQLILKNQFHDILPGSCIQEVVEDALIDYRQIDEIGKEVRQKALSSLVKGIKPDNNEMIVFNSLSWARDGLVSIKDSERGISGILDPEGEAIPYQKAGDNVYFMAKGVPPLGYKVYRLIEAGTNYTGKNREDLAVDSSHGAITVRDDSSSNGDSNTLENRFFILEFNDRGNISRLYDKRQERELIPEGKEANLLQLYEDKSTYFDAWDISISDDKVYHFDEIEEIRLKENGEVYKSLYLRKRFNKSTIEQEIIVYADLPRIDFKTRVEWQERQMLLKAAFPLDITTDKANFDIAFGNVSRPVHNNTSWDEAKWEVPAHKWADLSEYGYGVSLLNDCKYGYDAKGSTLRITLLKGGIFPDPEADLGEHVFTYSLYPHEGDFRQGGTVQEGYNFNQPLQVIMGHKGSWEEPEANGDNGQRVSRLPAIHSFLSLEPENVILETIKKAEEGEGYILRCYEAYGQRTKARVKTSIPIDKVVECDLMEKALDDTAPKDVTEDGFSFEIKPYEIKTFKFHWK